MQVITCSFSGKVSEGTLEALSGACEEACKQMFDVLSVYVTAFYKKLNQDEDSEIGDEDEEEGALGL